MKGCDDYRKATVSITPELRSLDLIHANKYLFITFHIQLFHVAVELKVPCQQSFHQYKYTLAVDDRLDECLHFSAKY